MQCNITRNLQTVVEQRLAHNPICAILGPRQCGKTTLAKALISQRDKSVYLDLENPRDLAKLSDPMALFDTHADKLVCLDEIQRTPELFTVLRSVVDSRGKNEQFLILGSASRDLISQSSESLAGRVSYLELTPFLATEIPDDTPHRPSLHLRGGFPRSLLASSDEVSMNWRNDFIRTFLERDIGMLGFNLSPVRLRRFWQMCAHVHGALLNRSTLANSLGVSSHTVQTYVDILSETFMLRVLEPDHPTVKKRLVKSPKVFLRDSGILHALLGIETYEDLLGHPARGASFEGFVIENILGTHPGYTPSFYRTGAGAEMDLVLRKGRKTIAIEIKASSAPSVSKGFWNAMADLEADNTYVVAPVNQTYPLRDGVKVLPLDALLRML